ncbi:MAG: DUF4147 domain-containing protein [Parcubacteria group bacterium]|nr:DUF4147 domain-containing protein [Parcubacteria group bacterium]
MKRSIIKNFSELAVTKLRKDGLGILQAGLLEVHPGKALKKKVFKKDGHLKVGDREYDLAKYRRVFVIGIGKSAFLAAKQLEAILGDVITDGIVLDVSGGKLKRMKSRVGTHPFPSLANMQATGEIMALLKEADSRDLLIVVVSGGGSALLCWPYGIKCEDVKNMTSALMKKGATIRELNTVRKHTSEILGGQLSRMAYPATIVSLIFSDVPGDDISMVASGPTVLDTTTVKDAAAILSAHKILEACRMPNCELSETPKDPIFFKNVHNVLIQNNVSVLDSMAHAAKEKGYAVEIFSSTVSGEASDVGAMLAAQAKSGVCLIAGGETTVSHVYHGGRGGRNLELVLSGLLAIDPDTLLISCASDGIDNTPFAGAIADAVTLKKVKEKKQDIGKALKENLSFDFFKKNGQYIDTGGSTGGNISDIMLVLHS